MLLDRLLESVIPVACLCKQNIEHDRFRPIGGEVVQDFAVDIPAERPVTDMGF